MKSERAVSTSFTLHPSLFTLLHTLIATLAALVMLALSGRAMVQRGAPARARTIASRTGLSPRASENALLLLEKARRELPVGATVVFVDDRKAGSADGNHAVAVGQLPQQKVLPAGAVNEADYVILLHGSEGGEIFRRR